MSGNSGKIPPLQAYLAMTLSAGFTDHVLLSPVMLSIAKRDAWVGALGGMTASLLYAVLLAAVLKRDANARRAGSLRKLPRKAAEGLGLLYAALALAVTAKDTVTWTHVSYLPETPEPVIALLLLILCGLAARAGLRTIVLCSGVLLPLVAVLGLFVMGINLPYKEFTLLFPLFTHGFGPPAQTALISFAGTMDLAILLLLAGRISSQVRLPGLMAVSVCLGIFTTGIVIDTITIFGPFEAAELRYPLFEHWRMGGLGKFISHLDSLSIFQWLAGAFIRMSLMMYLLTELLHKSPRTNNPRRCSCWRPSQPQRLPLSP